MASATSHLWLASIIWHVNTFGIHVDLNQDPRSLTALPECYLVRSALVWGDNGVCRLLNRRQLSTWIWSIHFQAHLCRAVEAWLHLMFIYIVMEVFSLRNLCEQLVWVSQPCTGGSVGRITFSQHLILWEKGEELSAQQTLRRLKALRSGVKYGKTNPKKMKLITLFRALTSLLLALSCFHKYVSIRKKKQLLFLCTKVCYFDP